MLFLGARLIDVCWTPWHVSSMSVLTKFHRIIYKTYDYFLILFKVLIPGVFENCTGTKLSDTCEVRCHKNFERVIPYIQCGLNGTWSNIAGGKYPYLVNHKN